MVSHGPARYVDLWSRQRVTALETRISTGCDRGWSVLRQLRIDSSVAQGFGFVVRAGARRNTFCFSRAPAGATALKNKPAAGRYALAEH